MQLVDGTGCRVPATAAGVTRALLGATSVVLVVDDDRTWVGFDESNGEIDVHAWDCHETFELNQVADAATSFLMTAWEQL